MTHAALLSLLLAVGCGVLSPRGPTDVARGEYYAAGRPEYDSFFISLYEKQVQLLSAPSEPRAARDALCDVLGLTADASDDALAQRLGQELRKLAAQGLRVRLEVPPPAATPDASATLHTTESSAATRLRLALPQEGTRLVRARNRMLIAKLELEKLRVTGITLEGSVDRAFRTEGPWKRDEVRGNLNDGQKLITLMQSRAAEVEALATKLLTVLSSVAKTDESLGQTVVPAPPPPEPVKPRRVPAPRSTSKPASSPPARRAPTSRGDGEGAAPRPVQGSAPAEIEP